MELFTVFKNVVTLWQSTNKQKGAKQMTTYTHIDMCTLINCFNRSRAYSTVHAKYKKINYTCMTILIACYLFYTIRNKPFTKTALSKFVKYHQYRVISNYVDMLYKYDLLNLSGRNYSISLAGMDAIKEISDNVNSLLYSFCDKYNIEL